MQRDLRKLFKILDELHDVLEVVDLTDINTIMLQEGYQECEVDALVAAIKEPQNLLEDMLPGLQGQIDANKWQGG